MSGKESLVANKHERKCLTICAPTAPKRPSSSMDRLLTSPAIPVTQEHTLHCVLLHARAVAVITWSSMQPQASPWAPDSRNVCPIISIAGSGQCRSMLILLRLVAMQRVPRSQEPYDHLHRNSRVQLKPQRYRMHQIKADVRVPKN